MPRDPKSLAAILEVHDVDPEAAVRMLELALENRQPAQRRRARSTGTMVAVWRAEDLGMDPEDGPWVTLCEDHGGVVHHPTRALATSWAADPEGWCPGCQGEDDE